MVLRDLNGAAKDADSWWEPNGQRRDADTELARCNMNPRAMVKAQHNSLEKFCQFWIGKKFIEVIIVYFYQFPSDDEIYCENFTLFSFIIHKHDRPFSSPFISETIPPRLMSR